MRVLFDATGIYHLPHGIPKVSRIVLNEMQRRGWTIVCFYLPVEHRRWNWGPHPAVSAVPVDAASLVKIAAAFKPDRLVVTSPTMYREGMSPADIIRECIDEGLLSPFPMFAMVHDLIEKWTAFQAYTHLCCISKFTSDELYRTGCVRPHQTVSVTYHSYAPQPDCEKPQWGDFILWMYGSNPRKRLDRMLKILRLLPTFIRLVAVVGKEDEFKINELPPDLHSRVWFSRSPSPRRLQHLYNTCRLVAITSEAEGFCLPILEAADAGKTVICFDNTCLREIGGDVVTAITDLQGEPEEGEKRFASAVLDNWWDPPTFDRQAFLARFDRHQFVDEVERCPEPPGSPTFP